MIKLLLGLLLIIFSFSGCTDLFFYPDNDIRLNPKDIGLDYSETILYTNNNEKLVGWYLKSKTKEVKGRVLFLHGNAENMSTHIASVYWLPKYGYDVQIVGYPGYGLSEGSPNIDNMHEAGLLFADSLLECKNCPPLIIYGQSLGGSIGIWLSANPQISDKIKLAIIESTFSSYSKMARASLSNLGVFKYIFYPFSLLVNDQYSSKNYIKNIKSPLLLIHGTNDQIVPDYFSRDLHSLNMKSKLWLLPNKGHLEIFKDNELQKALIEKLN